MLWGLFQEALEAMFALINEMEMAIKINTAIIFANRAHIIGVKLNCLTYVRWCLSKVRGGWRNTPPNMKGC